MSDSRSPARRGLSLLILVLTALGLYNVMHDNTEVKELAKRAACGTGDCSPTQGERWPWGQTFVFPGKQGSVEVSCRRSLIFLGDYDCTKK